MSRRPRSWLALAVLLAGVPLPARADSLNDLVRTYMLARSTGSASVASRVYVPSFARQTGLACSACHYQFLTLTPYGRAFKLNGYVLTHPSADHGEGHAQRRQAQSESLLAALRHGNGGAHAPQGHAARYPERRRRPAAGAERLPGRPDHLEDGALLAVHLCRGRRDVRHRQPRLPVRQPHHRQDQGRLRPDAEQQSDGAGPVEHDAGLGLSLHRVGRGPGPGGGPGNRRRLFPECPRAWRLHDDRRAGLRRGLRLPLRDPGAGRARCLERCDQRSRSLLAAGAPEGVGATST